MDFLPINVGQYYSLNQSNLYRFYFIVSIDLEKEEEKNIKFYAAAMVCDDSPWTNEFPPWDWYEHEATMKDFESLKLRMENVTHYFVSTTKTFKQPLSNWVKI